MALINGNSTITPIDEVGFYPSWLASFADKDSQNYPESAEEVIRMVQELSKRGVATDSTLVQLICEKELDVWKPKLAKCTNPNSDDAQFWQLKVDEFSNLLKLIMTGELVSNHENLMKIGK